jgi:nucleoside 2-deoxyribosyltransferase
MKKITICGSMVFADQIIDLRNELGNLGFFVYTPEITEGEKNYSEMSDKEQIEKKNFFIKNHIEKIKNSDCILVANYDKKGIKNYIGANTFLEIGFAYLLGKKTFLLNDFPEQDNILEIKGLLPVGINNDLSKIKLCI